MKPFVLLLAATILTATALADSPDAKPGPATEMPAISGQEQGIYRFGATYTTSVEETASACQSLCASNEACFAWSFVSPVGDGAARCELKRGGGRVERNLFAVSGLSTRHEAKFIPPPPPSDLLGGSEGLPQPPSSKPGVAPRDMKSDGPMPLVPNASAPVLPEGL